jgi:ABC-type amino acid transport substrate-binding protein
MAELRARPFFGPAAMKAAGRAGATLLALAALASSPPAAAGPAVLGRVQADKLVKVCIWPDYYGISFRNPRTQQLQGLDIEMSAELGKELGARVEYVDSSFATLVQDLLQERCDVAMFGIGVTPQRQEHLQFTRPYLRSGLYGITTKSNAAVRSWTDIDQPGVLIGVPTATSIEPVMKAHVKRAQTVSMDTPILLERGLQAGRIDVVISNYPYARNMLDNTDWARLVEPDTPFNVLPYAYALRPGDAQWLDRLNRFVAQVQRDGRLRAAARRNGLSAIVVN